jgi:hypothetical protein
MREKTPFRKRFSMMGSSGKLSDGIGVEWNNLHEWTLEVPV